MTESFPRDRGGICGKIPTEMMVSFSHVTEQNSLQKISWKCLTTNLKTTAAQHYASNKHITCTLHWRHNDHDSVSNHQPHGCLLNRLFRRRSKKTSKLRVTGLCVGNSPEPVNSPHKGPVTRKFFPFDDVIMMWIQSDLSISRPAMRFVSTGLWANTIGKYDKYTYHDLSFFLKSGRYFAHATAAELCNIVIRLNHSNQN